MTTAKLKGKLDYHQMRTLQVLNSVGFAVCTDRALGGIFQQILKQMKNQITGNLNFEQLNTLKVKLEKLSRHLQKVMRSFALPMTVNFIADTIFLIACSCFLLISDDHRKAHYYCSIIFTHLIYCLLRISVYCLAGSLVVNQFDQLVVTTFEHVNNWSSRQLMLFQKISQLKFTVTIWGVYSVQQSTMLSILAFALSYKNPTVSTANAKRKIGVRRQKVLVLWHESFRVVGQRLRVVLGIAVNGKCRYGHQLVVLQLNSTQIVAISVHSTLQTN
ncbi:hypothetical protein TYRP_002021 [Tyrophagus putrescentiae]|nr:hypothetical protein TYRP_002021 [Tyrophagus putrescentiae]